MKKSLEEQVKEQVKYPTTYKKYVINKDYIKNLEFKKNELEIKEQEIKQMQNKLNEIKKNRGRLDGLISNKISYISNRRLIGNSNKSNKEQIDSLKTIIEQQQEMIEYYKKLSAKN
tara:strand:+ start:124 stop:471 length:348 start_codon:yes stop_codon:yes gene_type:complete